VICATARTLPQHNCRCKAVKLLDT